MFTSRRRRLGLGFAAFIGAVAGAGGAWAACSVLSANLNFGQVDPSQGVVIPVTGLISVTCSLGQTYAVGLSDGVNPSGATRRMKSSKSNSYLSYLLFKDLLQTSRFGDVSAQRSSQLGLGVAPNLIPVFGTIPSGQTANSGSYADTVMITVYY